ncbi:MAG: iron-sulfur cluster assembly protein [Thermoplasmata archaeon]|nr:iron-sulfur cluster assembly protein [Thermoplasmata archaeon]
MDDKELELEVSKHLNEVLDPETGISVMDMGLVQNLSVKDGIVHLVFVPSSPFCPLGVRIAFDIKNKVKGIPGVKGIDMRVEGHVSAKEITEQLKKE